MRRYMGNKIYFHIYEKWPLKTVKKIFQCGSEEMNGEGGENGEFNHAPKF